MKKTSFYFNSLNLVEIDFNLQVTSKGKATILTLMRMISMKEKGTKMIVMKILAQPNS